MKTVFLAITSWANKSIWPSQLKKMLNTFFLSRKSLVKFKQRHCLPLNHIWDLLNTGFYRYYHNIIFAEITQ